MNKDHFLIAQGSASQLGKRLARFCIPAFCLASALSALGQSSTFNVASGDWSTAGSWTAGVPGTGSGDVATLGGGRTATVTASTSVGNITTSTGSAFTISGGFDLNVIAGGTSRTLGGSTLTLSGSGTVLRFASTGHVISWANAAAATTISVGSGASMEFNQGTLTANFQGTGGKARTVSGAGSFSLGSAGTLAVGTSTASTLTMSVATFSSVGTINAVVGTMDISSTTATLANTLSFAGSSSVNYTGAGTLNLGTGGSTTLNVTGSSSGTFQLSSGTLNFNGLTDLDLAKTLTVAGGAITGNANVTGGAGSGTVSVTGNTVSVAPSGGNLSLSGVTLNFSGTTQTMTLDANSTAANTSETITAANVALGTGIALTINNSGGTWETGQPNKVRIIDATITDFGTAAFRGWAEGTTQTFGGQDFVYDITSSGVDLIAVPESEHYAVAFGAGLFGLAAMRRRFGARKA